MVDEISTAENEQLQGVAVKTIVDMVIESWRFSRLFIRLLSKMDAADTTRYTNQLNYFLEKLDENLQQFDMKVVNVEGHPYDTGMAATPVNIADFGPDDHLLVEQMLEPIIMGAHGIVRSGRVMLRKAAI